MDIILADSKVEDTPKQNQVRINTYHVQVLDYPNGKQVLKWYPIGETAKNLSFGKKKKKAVTKVEDKKIKVSEEVIVEEH